MNICSRFTVSRSVIETFNTAGSVAGQSVNVFQVAAAFVWRRGQSFALDGKQLLKVAVGSPFDNDGVQRHDRDVCTATGSLERLLKESDGIKTLTA